MNYQNDQYDDKNENQTDAEWPGYYESVWPDFAGQGVTSDMGLNKK